MDLKIKFLSFKKNFALKSYRKNNALIDLYKDYIDFLKEEAIKKIDNKTAIFREKHYRVYQAAYYDVGEETEIFNTVYNYHYEKAKKKLRLEYRAYRESTRRKIAELQKANKPGNDELIAELLKSIPAYEAETEAKLQKFADDLKADFEAQKVKGIAQNPNPEALRVMKEEIEAKIAADRELFAEKVNKKLEKKITNIEKKIAKHESKVDVKKAKLDDAVAKYLDASNVSSDNEAHKTADKLTAEIAKYKAQLEANPSGDKAAKIEKILETLEAQLGSIDFEKTSIETMIKDDEVLSVRDLCMYFGGIKAVNHLSFSVKEKEIFGLIGPNGAGKTTVFNCITQFYKATAGDIVFRNKNNEIVDLKKEVVHNVILQGVVRTFQNLEVIKDITVIENLLIAAHRSYTSGLFKHMVHSPILRVEENVIRARAIKVLEFMGLLKYKDMYAWGLPYGILKKIEIARTLMCNPQLIILDEPAAGLNDSETVELAALIRRIRDEYNSTILLVEHDMGLVMDVCDRICAISFGNLLALGTPTEIQQNKAVQEAYLGVSED